VRCLRAVAGLALVLALIGGARAADAAQWQRGAVLPVARSEVPAATFGAEIAVVAGFTADGTASTRADAYAPAGDTWRRLPDLPLAVHHAMAAGAQGRLYVLGGYGSEGRPQRTAFVLAGDTWQPLPPLPFPRAAAGTAVVDGRIVVAGGVVRVSGRWLARNALAFDLRTGRWSVVPGPRPREHLGVAALAHRVYAVAGRVYGFDTNLATFESWRPGERRWRPLPQVPRPRGGTGAAAVGGRIVSVGGEETAGTIEEAYAYRVASGRWQRLPNLPTPRHGLGVAAFRGSVFVMGGGVQPGLSVSSANEWLRVGP
jgi:hypothetical protein